MLDILLASLLFTTTPDPTVTPPATETRAMAWFLPDGGTPENVTWPQPIFTSQCGGWIQVDTYPYTTEEEKARTDALDDDGVLSYGEDHGYVLSWAFVEAPVCIETPEPTPEPTPVPTPEPVKTPEPLPTPITHTPVPTTPVNAPVPSPVKVDTISQPPLTGEREELAVTGISSAGKLTLGAIALVTLGLAAYGISRRPKRINLP